MFVAFPLGHKPDHGIRPSQSEAPGLLGGEFQQDAALGLVKDIVAPGLRGGGAKIRRRASSGAGRRGGVGSLDFGGEFEAVRFTVAETGPNFE
jgi:hypothetical protein